ncbi:MAG: Outer membrane porin protein [Burkholderia gladioli]|nr:MAG: Outer membrane porin protein [Burkholderia gladioli]
MNLSRHSRHSRHPQPPRLSRAGRLFAAHLASSLAAGAAMGAAASAHAQSSVPLYGTIDTAIVYANNAGGKRQFEMNSSNVLGNRWGLRGSEDLGNGLRAVFDLENGYSSTTGGFQQGGDLFGRQAWMGLASQRAGTLTAGRQYDAAVDFIGPFIAGTQWATYLGGHPGDLDNTNNDYRSNNSVKYTTPTIDGFRASGLYSFGGTPGQFGRNSIWSLGLGYTGGPFVLGAAYVHVKDPNFSYFGNNSTSSATGSNMAASRVYSGYASADNEQIVAVGGTYTVGPAIVGVVYTNTRFGELGAHASLDPLGYRGSARPTITRAATARIMSRISRATSAPPTSCRSVPRCIWGGLYQHASGTDSTGQAAVANINGLTASSTPNQVSVLAGITHRF